MQEKIYEILLEQDDVSWRTMLYDLVKKEGMDPWDIDLTQLSQKFIEMVKNMRETDLRISGKVFLAAAILLKIKSAHLIDHDIGNLDKLLNEMEEEAEYLDEEDWEDMTPEEMEIAHAKKKKYTLIPRNPQPRNRKVSIHDLVHALQHAMESKRRVLAKQKPIKFVMPERKIDITDLITNLYNKINYYAKKQEKDLSFTKLLPPRAGKREKAYTFIPMLHLENERKIEISQEKPFAEIYVKLQKEKKAVNKG